MVDDLRNGHKTVGLKQSLRAIESKSAVRAFIARDCAPGIIHEIENNCKTNGVPVEYVETMSELGTVCGIDVGAAVAVIVR